MYKYIIHKKYTIIMNISNILIIFAPKNLK